MKPTIHRIHQSFITLRKEGRLRHREIAEKLTISEGELIAAHVGLGATAAKGLRAIRLDANWPALIASIESIGEVMALTRNEACVHEKIGQYRHVSQEGSVGLVVGEIDLRIFYQHWFAGFAVIESGSQGERRSLQFFDAQGQAIHKVHLKPQSDVSEFDAIVSLFATPQQEPGLEVSKLKAKPTPAPYTEIDRAGFWQAWRDLKDTHDFYPLLRKYTLTRTQALRLAEPEFVRELSKDCLRSMLQGAAQTKTPIMVFVGNPGMIQIHSGPIDRIIEQGSWINVMDPRFNLHLRQDLIERAWIVRKPTVDGIVTSIEFFDQSGEAIAMFFGERKPGKAELASWRDLVTQIEGEHGLMEVCQ